MRHLTRKKRRGLLFSAFTSSCLAILLVRQFNGSVSSIGFIPSWDDLQVDLFLPAPFQPATVETAAVEMSLSGSNATENVPLSNPYTSKSNISSTSSGVVFNLPVHNNGSMGITRREESTAGSMSTNGRDDRLAGKLPLELSHGEKNSTSTTATTTSYSTSNDKIMARLASEQELTKLNQLLARYISQHSDEALRKHPQNRTFAIGFYSCPLQAGNRLNQFFNSLKWAIVTNRTLLWKYYDEETCRENEMADLRFKSQLEEVDLCAAANTEPDCARILQRASWIPSYDEWKDKLALDEPERLHYWSITPRSIQSAKNHYPFEKGVSHQHWGVDASKANVSLIIFPTQVGQDDYFLKGSAVSCMLHTDEGRKNARVLGSEDPLFLFGMLFRYSFQMMNAEPVAIPKDAFSVGMHSRHQLPERDGRVIRSEIKCFSEILSKRRDGQPCEAYLMSDRAMTLNNLKHWFRKSYRCTVHVANHTTGESFVEEHGPFAGAGFFEDMALVSQARDGFIGSITSSSSMVRSLIEYDRRIEALKAGMTELKKLEFCRLGVT